MTVTVILSSKQVDLDDNQQSILTLKATYSGFDSHTILYKVRTNSKQLVDVRPAFGALYRSSDDEAIVSLNIRYKGDAESLAKIKLQISWVWGLLPDEAKRKKLSHEQFTEQYAALKQKMGSEKTQILLFAMKSEVKQAQESIIFNEVEGRDNNDSAEDIVVEKDNTSDNKPIVAPPAALATKVQAPETVSKRLSIKVVLLFVVVFFLLGVLGGMRLQAYRSSIREETTDLQQLVGETVVEEKVEHFDIPAAVPSVGSQSQKKEVSAAEIAKIEEEIREFSDDI